MNEHLNTQQPDGGQHAIPGWSSSGSGSPPSGSGLTTPLPQPAGRIGRRG